MNEEGKDKGRTAQKRGSGLDVALVRELAALLDENALTEIEVEDAGMRIRLARMAIAPAPAPSAPPAVPVAPQQPEPEARRGTTVVSPMVGTVYLGPSPGAPPFVKVGDSVREEQTVVIVEAMKTMNHVPANVAGRVTEIYVQDGQPVEFGEPLMLIE